MAPCRSRIGPDVPFSAGMREVLFAAGIETLWAQVVMGILAGVLLPILVRETCLRIRVARPLAIA